MQKGLTKTNLPGIFMMQDACIRQIEIIGEATKKLSTEFRERYLHLPWKDIAGMRDKLIHNYFDVDIGVVWKTVEQDVAFLLNELLKIKSQL